MQGEGKGRPSAPAIADRMVRLNGGDAQVWRLTGHSPWGLVPSRRLAPMARRMDPA
jgi:hypothetical protein